jgi:hypothetical protein
VSTDKDTDWYWDLRRGRAVPAAERGPGEHTLGPYRTKGEAENWQSTVESRNEAWDAADEEWEARGSDQEPSAADE